MPRKARTRPPKAPKATGAATTPGTTPVATQRVGGADLWIGNPGNRGNPHPLGPPSALIRGELRGTYAERKVLLDEIARGDLIEQTSVDIYEVLPHIRCGQCAGPVVTVDPDLRSMGLTFPAKQTASVRDRLSALDQMAKYGVGTLKEVSVDNVRERVLKTLEAIRLHTDTTTAEVLYRALEPIWK